jgi:hypothetical protein
MRMARAQANSTMRGFRRKLPVTRKPLTMKNRSTVMLKEIGWYGASGYGWRMAVNDHACGEESQQQEIVALLGDTVG